MIRTTIILLIAIFAQASTPVEWTNALKSIKKETKVNHCAATLVMVERKTESIVKISIMGIGCTFNKAVFSIKSSSALNCEPLVIQSDNDELNLFGEGSIPVSATQFMVNIFGRHFDPTIFIAIPPVGKRPEVVKILLNGPSKS